jgi:ubiquitination network signaling protein AcrB
MRKEVETLSGRLSGSGSSDDRQKQRSLQLSRDIDKADQATVDLVKEIEALGDIPEEDHDAYNTHKQAWTKEKDRHTAATEEFARSKLDADRQASHVKSEITSAVQKRERLAARQAKLNEQLERLKAAQAEGKSVAEHKAHARAAIRLQRANQEHHYKQALERFQNQISTLKNHTSQMTRQIEMIESAFAQQALHQSASVPTTPEGPLPGTAGPLSNNGVQSNFHSFQFPTPFGAIGNNSTNNLRSGRGRSSSMLSEVSGFTEDPEDILAGSTAVEPTSTISPVATNASVSAFPSFSPFAQDTVPFQRAPGSRPNSQIIMPSNQSIWNPFNGLSNTMRKGSSGSGSGSMSGSGSASANGSQRDPLSPIQASVTTGKSSSSGSSSAGQQRSPGLIGSGKITMGAGF